MSTFYCTDPNSIFWCQISPVQKAWLWIASKIWKWKSYITLPLSRYETPAVPKHAKAVRQTYYTTVIKFYYSHMDCYFRTTSASRQLSSLTRLHQPCMHDGRVLVYGVARRALLYVSMHAVGVRLDSLSYWLFILFLSSFLTRCTDIEHKIRTLALLLIIDVGTKSTFNNTRQSLLIRFKCH